MLVNSEMVMPIGSKAPDFSLPNYQNNMVNGNVITLKELKPATATVVMFICNHCPYVVHIREKLCEVVADYQEQGVRFIAINSNDINTHPQDGPEFMMQQGFDFMYLYDASQDVARAYNAACTPDFYLFDSQLSCFYRGRFDDATPGNNNTVTGRDLTAAIDALLQGDALYQEKQHPSMGCNIKWSQS